VAVIGTVAKEILEKEAISIIKPPGEGAKQGVTLRQVVARAISWRKPRRAYHGSSAFKPFFT